MCYRIDRDHARTRKEYRHRDLHDVDNAREHSVATACRLYHSLLIYQIFTNLRE